MVRTEKIKFPIIPGTRFNIQIGYNIESGTIRELVSELDSDCKTVIKKKPRILSGGCNAVVIIQLENRACMETVANFDCYSRIQILNETVTVGFGKVIELID